MTSLGVEADPDDIEVALRYRAEQFAFGDMYESIRAIETGLHRLVREVLEGEHGIGEKGWWRKSVPLSIRQKCVDRREEDEEPADDPYAYTDLLDLARIAEKEWQTVSARLPKDAAANRKRFVQDLERMNRIRRMVMHPVRGLFPSEDDFQFVHDLERKLGLNK